MARERRRKVLAAQKAGRLDEDSLLVQSAESLARVIGALQRQVHRALTKTGQDDKASSKPPSRKPSARKNSSSKKVARAKK